MGGIFFRHFRPARCRIRDPHEVEAFTDFGKVWANVFEWMPGLGSCKLRQRRGVVKRRFATFDQTFFIWPVQKSHSHDLSRAPVSHPPLVKARHGRRRAQPSAGLLCVDVWKLRHPPELGSSLGGVLSSYAYARRILCPCYVQPPHMDRGEA